MILSTELHMITKCTSRQYSSSSYLMIKLPFIIIHYPGNLETCYYLFLMHWNQPTMSRAQLYYVLICTNKTHRCELFHLAICLTSTTDIPVGPERPRMKASLISFTCPSAFWSDWLSICACSNNSCKA